MTVRTYHRQWCPWETQKNRGRRRRTLAGSCVQQLRGRSGGVANTNEMRILVEVREYGEDEGVELMVTRWLLKDADAHYG